MERWGGGAERGAQDVFEQAVEHHCGLRVQLHEVREALNIELQGHGGRQLAAAFEHEALERVLQRTDVFTGAGREEEWARWTLVGRMPQESMKELAVARPSSPSRAAAQFASDALGTRGFQNPHVSRRVPQWHRDGAFDVSTALLEVIACFADNLMDVRAAARARGAGDIVQRETVSSANVTMSATFMGAFARASRLVAARVAAEAATFAARVPRTASRGSKLRARAARKDYLELRGALEAYQERLHVCVDASLDAKTDATMRMEARAESLVGGLARSCCGAVCAALATSRAERADRLQVAAAMLQQLPDSARSTLPLPTPAVRAAAAEHPLALARALIPKPADVGGNGEMLWDQCKLERESGNFAEWTSLVESARARLHRPPESPKTSLFKNFADDFRSGVASFIDDVQYAVMGEANLEKPAEAGTSAQPELLKTPERGTLHPPSWPSESPAALAFSPTKDSPPLSHLSHSPVPGHSVGHSPGVLSHGHAHTHSPIISLPGMGFPNRARFAHSLSMPSSTLTHSSLYGEVRAGANTPQTTRVAGPLPKALHPVSIFATPRVGGMYAPLPHFGMNSDSSLLPAMSTQAYRMPVRELAGPMSPTARSVASATESALDEAIAEKPASFQFQSL